MIERGSSADDSRYHRSVRRHRLVFASSRACLAACLGALGTLGVVAACSSFEEQAPGPGSQSDAPVGDEQTSPEASSEAAADTGPRFCSSIDATACVDFEDGLIAPAGWVVALDDDAGTAGVVTGENSAFVGSFTAAPSLTPDGGDPTTKSIQIAHTLVLPPNVKIIEVEADVLPRISSLRGLSTLISVAASSIEEAASVVVTPAGLGIAVGAARLDGGYVIDVAPRPLNRWFHIKLVVTIGGASQLFVDDVSLIGLDAGPARVGSYFVSGGLTVLETPMPATALIDNIVVRTKL